MPRRTDAPPPRAPQSEPFETTGAFALPADAASGFPPASDSRSPFQPPQRGEEAGPMETTGAFARPPEWGPPADRPFNRPGAGPTGDPADQTAVFGGPAGMPAPGAPGSGHASAFSRPADDGQFGDPAHQPFGDPAHQPFGGPANQPGPFGAPGERSDPFASDDRSGPFGGPDDRTAFFDGAADRSGFFDEPDDRTARFDVPPGPVHSSGPPEPGDVKVAGAPTAAHAPAWANTETGFLGSGWSSDSGPGEPEEPRDRRGRRKGRRDDELLPGASPSGGKGRVALLSVAAVAVVLGGTVAGVKFMSTSGGTDKCAGTTCAAVQGATNRPGPEVSQPPVEETEPEEEPSDEPVKDTGPAETPTPTVTYNPRPRHTEQARPTPTKTRVKKSKEPAKEPAQEPAQEPDEESVPQDTPMDQPSSVDADIGAAPTTTSVPEPTDSGSFGSPPGTGSVNVQQTIRQRMTTYAVNLRLSNTSTETLQNPTVSVPVEGRVVDVRGADWTQDGDLLILDVSAQLAAGATVEVSFTATGRGAPAANCGMVTGECVVS
ncbi:hypothetical protein E1292_10425 [Nonomuraea deserti]|uniref:CBM2 domain-containing protein n=1 Tax=Nonomuraea deserti TaxID=1848322 RepID=A0A4R4W7B6_9ACTN|nr:hypothetical protein [Nonomuraea deserti]TDD09090.1 hypothetical protein E1292_10425 [Nonomuraea deserti]